MKKITTFSTVFFAKAFLVLALFSCKKNKCPEGFVNMDNTCVCPQDKFEGNGMCRDLKPNEYYASLEHCICKDTIFFEIIERTPELLYVRLDLGWGFQENAIGLIPMVDGDSLYTDIGTYTSELACPINGRLTNTQIFGKFIENDRKIRVTLKYVAIPNLEELGRCDFILHQ